MKKISFHIMFHETSWCYVHITYIFRTREHIRIFFSPIFFFWVFSVLFGCCCMCVCVCRDAGANKRHSTVSTHFVHTFESRHVTLVMLCLTCVWRGHVKWSNICETSMQTLCIFDYYANWIYDVVWASLQTKITRKSVFRFWSNWESFMQNIMQNAK